MQEEYELRDAQMSKVVSFTFTLHIRIFLKGNNKIEKNFGDFSDFMLALATSS